LGNTSGGEKEKFSFKKRINLILKRGKVLCPLSGGDKQRRWKVGNGGKETEGKSSLKKERHKKGGSGKQPDNTEVEPASGSRITDWSDDPQKA